MKLTGALFFCLSEKDLPIAITKDICKPKRSTFLSNYWLYTVVNIIPAEYTSANVYSL